MSDYTNDYPYPLNLTIAVCGERLTERDLPDDAPRGLQYVLDNLKDQRMAEMLRLRFQDGLTYRKIGEQYGLTAQRVRQIVERGLRVLRHPARYYYIRYGYMAAKKREAERGERQAWEAARRNAVVEALERGQNAGPLHEIADISLRVDAILARSGFEEISMRRLKLAPLYCSLFERGCVKVWQLCFLTEKDIMALPPDGKSAVSAIQKHLARLGLELDDGTLSSDPNAFNLAKDRFYTYQQVLGR